MVNIAEKIFHRDGFIPFDVASKLMAAGYDVERLEKRWARTNPNLMEGE